MTLLQCSKSRVPGTVFIWLEFGRCVCIFFLYLYFYLHLYLYLHLYCIAQPLHKEQSRSPSRQQRDCLYLTPRRPSTPDGAFLIQTFSCRNLAFLVVVVCVFLCVCVFVFCDPLPQMVAFLKPNLIFVIVIVFVFTIIFLYLYCIYSFAIVSPL